MINASRYVYPFDDCIESEPIIEAWKDIIGYEGFYQISNLGNVKNVKKDKLVKNIYNTTIGYYKVTLSKNNVRINKNVHRMVAIAFIPNPLNKPQVNHLDANKLNNRVDNLEWATKRENCQHALANNLNPHIHRKGDKNPTTKISEASVIELRASKEKSLAKLAKRYGISVSYTWMLKTNQRRSN